MRDTAPHVGHDPVLARLQTEVIAAGLCIHCGTCSGLSAGTLAMRETTPWSSAVLSAKPTSCAFACGGLYCLPGQGDQLSGYVPVYV